MNKEFVRPRSDKFLEVAESQFEIDVGVGGLGALHAFLRGEADVERVLDRKSVV